ncbi:hypothetical protein FHS57_004870 [Runella defluvii]|uniref:Glycosyltransferase RgtA/B/C/D-like domain-containing protein n=1 Tax=Runella defluvii TaxID=370973 RepID=A0A7W5ZQE7_9BACT|nr:hypothetical protein [Runella defluvii]MBB3840850.1 hypothetical protein [Runella defluvii]
MQFSSWLDFGGSPIFWWLIGHIFLGSFTLWLILKKRPFSEFFFISALFLFSGFMRLPIFLYNLPLNPDESQMLAQGLTLTVDPLIYRSFDPTTSGPINTYLLTLVHLLGFPLNFHTAHVLSWLVTLTAIYFLYKALNYLVPTYLAQLAVIPTIAFVSFAQDANYIHYYSEGIASILLSYCIFLLVRWGHLKTYTITELIAFGVSITVIVLCKIQAIPLAFILGVWSLVLLFMLKKKKWVLHAVIVSGSVLAVAGIWLLYMQVNGLLDDFFLYYIVGNAQLKVHFNDESYRSPWLFLVRFPFIIYKKTAELNYWFVPFLVLGFVFFFTLFSKTVLTKVTKSNYYFWPMMFSFFLMVIAVIIRTGSFYPHHFLYFIIPGCLLTGLFLQQLTFPSIWKWGVLLTQLVFLGDGIKRLVNHFPLNVYETAYSRQNELGDVSKTILKYGKPGDYLAVWGWSCEYHVETQMPQGVNENHSVRSAMKHPLQSDYYQRYLHDLQRTKPKVFVDAITSKTIWMNDPKKYGHQNYPELAKFVADNYVFKAEIDSVKIYVAR